MGTLVAANYLIDGPLGPVIHPPVHPLIAMSLCNLGPANKATRAGVFSGRATPLAQGGRHANARFWRRPLSRASSEAAAFLTVHVTSDSGGTPRSG